jgi:hypothetical protein
VRAGLLGVAGLLGFAGAELPQPVDTEVRPPVFTFAFSNWLFARSDRPVVFPDLPPVTVFAFHPPPVDELPHPVDTGVRGVGFFGAAGFAGAAPQPVAVGRRALAFPTVMGGSLSTWSTARNGTSCRGR